MTKKIFLFYNYTVLNTQIQEFYFQNLNINFCITYNLLLSFLCCSLYFCCPIYSTYLLTLILINVILFSNLRIHFNINLTDF